MLLTSSLSVVTPAPSLLLVSVAEAREDIDFDDDDSDSIVERWILAASARITAFLRRPLLLESLAETFYLRALSRGTWGPSFLQLSRRPVAGTPVITVDDVVLTTDEYVLKPDAGTLFRMDDDSQVSWSGIKAVVEYDAGYDGAAEVPGDIRQACIDLVRLAKASTTRDAALRSLEIPGVATETYQTTMQGDVGDLPPGIMDAILRHRSVRV